MKTRGTLLTLDERRVVILASQQQGTSLLSNREIAQRLGLPVNRVKDLLHQACVKLGARNRCEAILSALRWGEVRLDELYSLEELAQICSSLAPETLRQIAGLMRRELDPGDLATLEERIVCRRTGPDGLLTAREREVLALSGRGCTNADIAAELYMSASSVSTFLHRACAKLGVRKRTEALVMALKRREISIAELASLGELLQMLEPLGPEAVEKMAEALDRKPGPEPVTAGN